MNFQYFSNTGMDYRVHDESHGNQKQSIKQPRKRKTIDAPESHTPSPEKEGNIPPKINFGLDLYRQHGS